MYVLTNLTDDEKFGYSLYDAHTAVRIGYEGEKK